MKTLFFVFLAVGCLQLYSCKQCASCKKQNLADDSTERYKVCEKDFISNKEFTLYVSSLRKDGWECVVGP